MNVSCDRHRTEFNNRIWDFLIFQPKNEFRKIESRFVERYRPIDVCVMRPLQYRKHREMALDAKNEWFGKKMVKLTSKYIKRTRLRKADVKPTLQFMWYRMFDHFLPKFAILVPVLRDSPDAFPPFFPMRTCDRSYSLCSRLKHKYFVIVRVVIRCVSDTVIRFVFRNSIFVS